jgi:hypothetical protein
MFWWIHRTIYLGKLQSIDRISSMPRRIAAVGSARGFYTKYQLLDEFLAISL